MEGTGPQLLDLPRELLGLIFGHIHPRDMYPSCFLINKACTQAVRDETAWQRRCHLAGIETKEEHTTWMATFQQESIMVWDPQQCTVDLWERMILNKGIATMTDQTKLSFRSGVHCFDYHILRHESMYCGVGVIDNCWDCIRLKYHELKERYPFLYWNDGGFWDVSGAVTTIPAQPAQTWNAGHVIGVRVDFNKKTITFYLDSQKQRTVEIPSHVDCLWPTVTLYDRSDSIEIKSQPSDYYND